MKCSTEDHANDDEHVNEDVHVVTDFADPSAWVGGVIATAAVLVAVELSGSVPFSTGVTVLWAFTFFMMAVAATMHPTGAKEAAEAEANAAEGGGGHPPPMSLAMPPTPPASPPGGGWDSTCVAKAEAEAAAAAAASSASQPRSPQKVCLSKDVLGALDAALVSASSSYPSTAPAEPGAGSTVRGGFDRPVAAAAAGAGAGDGEDGYVERLEHDVSDMVARMAREDDLNERRRQRAREARERGEEPLPEDLEAEAQAAELSGGAYAAAADGHRRGSCRSSSGAHAYGLKATKDRGDEVEMLRARAEAEANRLRAQERDDLWLNRLFDAIATGTQLGLGVSSIAGFVIISGAPHVNLGIIFGGVCMAVQGIECTSWLLAEKLHLGWAMRLVEGAEGWEDVTTTRANSWLQATAAVHTEIWKHSLRDADLWVARQLRQFEKRTGGDDGRGAWLLDTLAYVWRRQERSLQTYGSSIRQSPIKSMSSAIALMLAVEAGYCVLTVPSTHSLGGGGGGGGDGDGYGGGDGGGDGDGYGGGYGGDGVVHSGGGHHRMLMEIGSALAASGQRLLLRLGRRMLLLADAHGDGGDGGFEGVHGGHGEHGGHDADFCAAEAGHHLVNIGLELTSAIIAGASTSDFVRSRAKKAEYVRTQRRELERKQKLLAEAIKRREARMHLDMSPEELEAWKRRRQARGDGIRARANAFSPRGLKHLAAQGVQITQHDADAHAVTHGGRKGSTQPPPPHQLQHQKSWFASKKDADSHDYSA